MSAIYVRFTRVGRGTRLIATNGYNGPQIAHLLWARPLTAREESELAAAVRAAQGPGRHRREVDCPACDFGVCDGQHDKTRPYTLAEWDIAQVRKALAGHGTGFHVSRERLENLLAVIDDLRAGTLASGAVSPKEET